LIGPDIDRLDWGLSSFWRNDHNWTCLAGALSFLSASSDEEDLVHASSKQRPDPKCRPAMGGCRNSGDFSACRCASSRWKGGSSPDRFLTGRPVPSGHPPRHAERPAPLVLVDGTKKSPPPIKACSPGGCGPTPRSGSPSVQRRTPPSFTRLASTDSRRAPRHRRLAEKWRKRTEHDVADGRINPAPRWRRRWRWLSS